MTDPIKTIVDETLAAAEKATARPWYAGFNPNCADDVVDVLHDEAGAGYSLTETLEERDRDYIVTAANNAEKLALLVRELSEALEKIGVNAGDNDPRRIGHVAFGLFVTSTAVEALERARAIAAGKGDGG